MKTFKLIIKGVLLYVTILIILLYMCGIDSIYDQGYFLHSTVLVIMLLILCHKFISEKDLETLTLQKYFNSKNKISNK